MAGLVPAIHAFIVVAKTWMPGTSPGMKEINFSPVSQERHSGERQRKTT